jgi:peptidoglycan-N-acetylglucosamine deacetylase
MRLFIFLFLIFSSSVVAQPVISFTFDDGNTSDFPGYRWDDWNEKLLNTFDAHNLKVALFFTGGDNSQARKEILESWNSKGHMICNHTLSHQNFNKTSFEAFSYDFLRNDSIIKGYSNYTRLFRFPFLKEGDTKEKIEAFRKVLSDNGYRNGHVTIDASDWYVHSRLVDRLKENPEADIEGFRKYYLDHLYEKALYYEDISYKLTGRHINHTLLLHHNLAAALFLDDLIKMFKEKGWKVVNAKEAFKDPIFLNQPGNVPAGESLIWALARQSGKFDGVIRYPAEDSHYEKEKMDKLGL